MGKRSDKRDILKRLEMARDGLDGKTCPASRHVHMIVEGLLDAKSGLAKDLAGYEPDHMAGSIASVLEGIASMRGTSRESLRVSPEMHRARAL